MTTIPRVPDTRSYVSPNVFDGMRPLSAARLRHLQRRFGNPPPRRHRNVFSLTMAVLITIFRAVVARLTAVMRSGASH